MAFMTEREDSEAELTGPRGSEEDPLLPPPPHLPEWQREMP